MKLRYPAIAILAALLTAVIRPYEVVTETIVEVDKPVPVIVTQPDASTKKLVVYSQCRSV